MRKLVIAIDGPAGAGKSTVAQIVAERLEYTYIDTGAMYRAVTLFVLRKNISVCDVEAVSRLARESEITLAYEKGKTRVYLNGEDVSEAIRMPEVSRMVSHVALIPAVRQAMLKLQRQMAARGGVVMDGRDIGTQVLPNADIKVFLTASIEERAKRRWQELTSKGIAIDLEELKEEIACRDRMDCERETAPLIKAPDAVLIDTTGLSIEGVVQEILKLCEERRKFV
ncbi:cytidylate kinase [Thermosinus carboxydivorans Nor1]|uniref:Cytidylate kinase n=1 Tax=Thermosinus carboxydivorans Nor1 TaxID=401526 RepID=A1HTW8_9FIRM|nr:(d)CMP kinase [Thermosinus carboxydivorans]EAX46544.1 cytidylate kinase [Thermosinus carboxydivorans Nor1]